MSIYGLNETRGDAYAALNQEGRAYGAALQPHYSTPIRNFFQDKVDLYSRLEDTIMNLKTNYQTIKQNTRNKLEKSVDNLLNMYVEPSLAYQHARK